MGSSKQRSFESVAPQAQCIEVLARLGTSTLGALKRGEAKNATNVNNTQLQHVEVMANVNEMEVVAESTNSLANPASVFSEQCIKL